MVKSNTLEGIPDQMITVEHLFKRKNLEEKGYKRVLRLLEELITYLAGINFIQK